MKSNLEAAAKDPDTMAQGLANACETAVRFARSMRRILVGMGDIEDKILGKPDAASILRTFFRDFVDGLYSRVSASIGFAIPCALAFAAVSLIPDRYSYGAQ